MSGADLATKLEVSAATISRIRSGDRRPSLDLILRIKDVLDWPVDEQATALAESTSKYGFEFSKRADERSGSA